MTKKTNILLINHYAGSLKNGMEFRPYYLANWWQKYGAEVLITGATYSHIRKTNPSKVGPQTIDGVNYFWLWCNKYSGNGIMRLMSMLVFVLQLFVMIPYFALKFRPTIVIASSTYPLDTFPAYVLAKLCRAKLIFEIHDLWPLSPMELGGMSKFHPFILLMRFGEWFSYKVSDKVVSILPCTYEHVKKDGVPLKQFMAIENGIEIANSKYVKIDPELSKHIASLKTKYSKVIVYAGSIGIANDLKTVVKALNYKEKCKDVYFIALGSGPECKNLLHLKNKYEINNFEIIAPIAKQQVVDFLSKIDITFISLQKQPLFRFGVSPNKIFDYMLAKKPIIQAIEAGNNLVQNANCGFSIEPSNAEALADCFEQVSKMGSKELNKLGENGYKYVVQNHDYKVLAKKFLDFICKA